MRDRYAIVALDERSRQEIKLQRCTCNELGGGEGRCLVWGDVPSDARTDAPNDNCMKAPRALTKTAFRVKSCCVVRARIRHWGRASLPWGPARRSRTTLLVGTEYLCNRSCSAYDAQAQATPCFGCSAMDAGDPRRWNRPRQQRDRRQRPSLLLCHVFVQVQLRRIRRTGGRSVGVMRTPGLSERQPHAVCSHPRIR